MGARDDGKGQKPAPAAAERAAAAAATGSAVRPARRVQALAFTRNIAAGEIVGPQDLEWSDTVIAGGDAPGDVDAVIGMAAKRPLRAGAAVSAVQAGLAKRLSGGMQFLASVGASGPFIGLFGTVYGIMNSFIGIANTNTTNLAVVAPGIAEALLATGIGLFAAIPAVIFYNYFQTRISAYGTRSEGFVAELTNNISRQLDKGA